MMKYIRNYLYISLLLSFASSGQAQNRLPNIVVIFADDLGWADLGSYGSTFYETPNLDRLAAGGIKFEQAYSTSPVCSPARSSLMTGKYPAKTGVTDWIKGRQDGGKARPFEKMIAKPTAFQLLPGETTMAEIALANGYRTFFAGKWHLGEEEIEWPEHHGFEINIGGTNRGGPIGKVNDTVGGYFTPYKNPRLPDGPPGEYITDRLTDECIAFLEKQTDAPFLMVHSLYAVHNPMQAPTALVKKYEAKRDALGIKEEARFAKDEPWMKHQTDWRRRLVQDHAVYAAMVENMDANMGRIWDKLKEKGLDENTIIIFSSDNGGLSTSEGSPTTNGPLRNGKGWLYEGGIRVPLIMYQKGSAFAGTVSALPVTLADVFTTVARKVDVQYQKPDQIDGEEIFSMMKNSNRFYERPIYWHYPHYSNQGGRPGSAIREGDWKLIYHYEDQSIELFNLNQDIEEQNNLAVSHVKKASKLLSMLMKWLQDTGATFPVPNPGYKGE